MKLIYAFWFGILALLFGVIGFTEFGALAITFAQWLCVLFAVLAVIAVLSSGKKPTVGEQRDFSLLTEKEKSPNTQGGIK